METYTPEHRDNVEIQLYEKPEIYAELRDGTDIVIYWVRKTGLISMSLSQNNQTREFLIPSDKVPDAIAHPEFYANEAHMQRPT